MSPMTWSASSRRLPGAHRAQPCSRLAALESAAPMAVGSASPATPPEAPGPAAEALAGGWTRGTTPSLALTHATDFAPPDRSTRWQAVEVPDNYGTDPDLRHYFGPVWYRRQITRPRGPFADLTFGAVDYLADVVLDGEHLGRHEGYFAPFLFDLSDRLAPGATADLLVRVQDPLEDLPDRRLFTRHRKRWIKGVLNYHDSRAGGMPGRMTPGWSFPLGQSPPTGGIVGPVAIEATRPVPHRWRVRHAARSAGPRPRLRARREPRPGAARRVARLHAVRARRLADDDRRPGRRAGRRRAGGSRGDDRRAGAVVGWRRGRTRRPGALHARHERRDRRRGQRREDRHLRDPRGGVPLRPALALRPEWRAALHAGGELHPRPAVGPPRRGLLRARLRADDARPHPLGRRPRARPGAGVLSRRRPRGRSA